MGGHTEYAEVWSVEGIINCLRETDKKCSGELGLHFRFMEVKEVNEKQLLVVKIRYTK